MSGNTPFAPVLPTVQLAAATSSTNVALGTVGRTSQTDAPTPQGCPTFPGGFSVRLTVAGSQNMQVSFGTSSAVAATSASSMLLRAGSDQVISVPESTTYIAQISPATGSILYATPGNGGL